MNTSHNRAAQQAAKRVSDTLVNLGQRLVTARQLRGMHQSEVAAAAGIGVVTLRDLEHGTPGVAVGNLLKVLDSLGLLSQMDSVLDPARDPETVAFAMRKLGEKGR